MPNLWQQLLHALPQRKARIYVDGGCTHSRRDPFLRLEEIHLGKDADSECIK